MLKILQARIQQYMNGELPDVQAGFRKVISLQLIKINEKKRKERKDWGTSDQIANIHWIIKKQENSRNTSTSALLIKLRPLTVWVIKTVGNSFSSVQFSSVQSLSCVWLCDHMNHSSPGLPAHHQIPVCPASRPLSQWCHQTISSSIIPFSFFPQSFPASGSFPMSQLFTSGGQSIGVSASASVLSMNT